PLHIAGYLGGCRAPLWGEAGAAPWCSQTVGDVVWEPEVSLRTPVMKLSPSELVKRTLYSKWREMSAIHLPYSVSP
ncbi:unnamed protein product, partial [Bubo scandiacus]